MSDETATHVPQMTPDDLRKRLEEGRPITVLDLRPEEDFEEWRIPGSINIDAH